MELIKQLKTKPLSNFDILEAVDNECNLVTYSDIKNYKSLDELLGPHKCCVILYESDNECGHWVLIMKHKNGEIEFFDPYGVKIDSELKWYPSMKVYPELTKLLVENGKPVVYNDRPLQSKSKQIATCGYHCVSRIKLKDMDVDDYCDLMKSFKKQHLNSDDMAVIFSLKL